MSDKGPYTAIVVGSGCSVGLGIPPLAGFLDTVMDKLKLVRREDYRKSRTDLKAIQAFISRIKGAAAYVRADLLNIEELYGMADMDEDLWKAANQPSSKEWYGFSAPDGLDPQEVKKALNRAIFFLAEPAGKEFLTNPDHFPSNRKELVEIKRESATETIVHSNQGSRWTNLMAYLCLASFQDRNDRYPLFIQFNWDLALDRALYFWSRKIRKKNATVWEEYTLNPTDNKTWLPWYGKEWSGCLCHKDWPRLARPHGGINWINCGKESFLCFSKEEEINNTALVEKLMNEDEGKLDELCYRLYPAEWNKEIWIDTHSVCNKKPPNAAFRSGEYMEIVPPTWRKQATKPAYEAQWGYINQGLQHVRRIIFIGYSLPKTDLYFRHFLALSLADNPHLPKVYVVNPEINKAGGVRENFLDLFEPLAREGRLYGVAGRFGDPALFDLHRIFKIAKRIK